MLLLLSLSLSLSLLFNTSFIFLYFLFLLKGGGEFWVSGYRSMLNQTRASSQSGVILTESNAEPYIGAVDVYLALTAFSEVRLDVHRKQI